jgi:hypothetical protein
VAAEGALTVGSDEVLDETDREVVVRGVGHDSCRVVTGRVGRCGQGDLGEGAPEVEVVQRLRLPDHCDVGVVVEQPPRPLTVVDGGEPHVAASDGLVEDGVTQAGAAERLQRGDGELTDPFGPRIGEGDPHAGAGEVAPVGDVLGVALLHEQGEAVAGVGAGDVGQPVAVQFGEHRRAGGDHVGGERQQQRAHPEAAASELLDEDAGRERLVEDRRGGVASGDEAGDEVGHGHELVAGDQQAQVGVEGVADQVLDVVVRFDLELDRLGGPVRRGGLVVGGGPVFRAGHRTSRHAGGG